MKINNNNIWQWYIDFFLGNSGKARPLLNKKNNNDNCDTVHVSYETKRKLRNEYIEKALNSGEPLTGISYEEYRDYFIDKHHYVDNYKIEHEYK